MQFNSETFRSDIESLTCQRCGTSGQKEVVIRPDGPHFAAIRCLNCMAHIDWLGFPQQHPSERRRKRRRLVSPETQCEICLRATDDLPTGEALRAHHLDEWGLGGSDNEDNVRVYCSACHSLVEWARTYFGHQVNAAELPF